MRIRLNFSDHATAARLSNLPWELLRDSDNDLPLMLGSEISLARYISTRNAGITQPIKPPFKVLVALAAFPESLSPAIDTDAEWTAINQALAAPIRRGQVTLARLANPTVTSLRDHLKEGAYHALHFIGHGIVDPETNEGRLILADDAGQPAAVDGETLGVQLRGIDSLRLVVLNACDSAQGAETRRFTGVAPLLIEHSQIPAVIGMRYRISDRAAILFSRAFYPALVNGRPLDSALTEARLSIHGDSKTGTEWSSPVLHICAVEDNIFRLQLSGLRRIYNAVGLGKPARRIAAALACLLVLFLVAAMIAFPLPGGLNLKPPKVTTPAAHYIPYSAWIVRTPAPGFTIERMWGVPFVNTAQTRSDFSAVMTGLEGTSLRFTGTARGTAPYSAWWQIAQGLLAESDFEVTVAARRITGGDDIAYGLIFRSASKDDHFYAFLIRDTGEFAVLEHYREQQLVQWAIPHKTCGSLDWITTQTIRSGTANVLGVRTEQGTDGQSRIAFYINNTQVCEIPDQGSAPGGVGVIVQLPTKRAQEGSLIFADFQLRVPGAQ